jgi:tight adherence protein B
MFFLTLLIFGAALYGAGYYVWTVPEQQAARDLGIRMRELRASVRARGPGGASELLRREQKGTFAALGDVLAWVGGLRRLQTYIEQANLKYRATDVAVVTVMLFGGCFLLFGLFGLDLFFVRLLVAALISVLPTVYILRKRSRRLKKFEENLPDAIDLFTRTMRAGHNIHSGLETIAGETVDPVRAEFRKMMEELALGSQLEPALHNLGQRVPLIDLKFFITALILQRQTGANMVAVLENLSSLVRERLNMAARLKAHTAQQRFSAGLLCSMPFVVGLGFWVLKPEYIRLLYTDPVGTKFLTYAIISEAVGILVIRRIANIRV